MLVNAKNWFTPGANLINVQRLGLRLRLKKVSSSMDWRNFL